MDSPESTKSEAKSESRAIISLLLTATLWGVIWYPLRQLELAGIGGLWSSLLIYGSLIPIGLWLVRGQGRQISRHPVGIVLIALASGWTNVAFIVAVIDGNVVRVLLLFYLSPVWAILFAWLHLEERPHLWALLTVVVAMSGAMVMLWDPDLDMPWPRERSDWLALTAGMGFAAANVAVRATTGLALKMKMLSSWLGVAAVALVWIVLARVGLPEVSAWGLGLVILLAAAMLLMTMLQQYGVAQLPVYRSSIIMLFELVAGAVSAQLLTDEVIQTREWIGGSLIILAAWVTARMQHEEELQS